MKIKLLLCSLVFLILPFLFFQKVSAQVVTNPDTDPDVNIRLRGFKKAVPPPPLLDSTLGIIWKYHFGSDAEIDPQAPQLSGVVGSSKITALYQINERSGEPISQNGTSNWGATLVNLAASPGTPVLVPESGYDIGGGYQFILLYADPVEGDVTLNSTAGEAGITIGYTIHLLNFDIDKGLLDLYNQSKAKGEVLALPCSYKLGTSRGAGVLVSIRDTGTFFDPRSGYDWWQRDPTPLPCLNLPPKSIKPGTAPGGGRRAQPYVPKEVPCNESTPYSEQYHSLRPYPTSPCNKEVSEVALFCGNDLVVKKSFKNLPPSGACSSNNDGTQTCRYSFTGLRADVKIDLKGAQLPILGNTELVLNSTDRQGSNPNKRIISNTVRVNNYVSWYLNGAIERAEEDPVNLDVLNNVDKLINFSGPLRKLLPFLVASDNRSKQVSDADATKNQGENIRHDQTVACYDNNGNPVSCVKKPDSQEQNLTDWAECTNSPVGFFKCLFNQIFGGGNSKEKRLFPYIPYSSTEDRKGEVEISQTGKSQGQNSSTDIQSDNFQKVSNVQFTPVSTKHPLYFSHTQETVELATLLQSTFASLGQPWVGAETEGPPGNIPEGCEIVETRTNPGDNLYGEIDRGNDQQISGTLTFDTEFSCKTTPQTVDQVCLDTCKRQGAAGIVGTTTSFDCSKCISGGGCNKDVFASVSVYTKTPQVEEIWQRLVNGPMGVFKRFFPKTGVNSPLEEIKDIPGVTKASYTGSGEAVEVLAGNPSANRSGNNAQLFFPHIGSLSEYFLKGIQTALRPKGFGQQLEGAPEESSASITGVDNCTTTRSQKPNNTPSSSTTLSCSNIYVNPADAQKYANELKNALIRQQSAVRTSNFSFAGWSAFYRGVFEDYNLNPNTDASKQKLFGSCCGQSPCYEYILNRVLNESYLNPYLVMAIALNENGGLLTNDPEGKDPKHFGCDPFGRAGYATDIGSKLTCLLNTFNKNQDLAPGGAKKAMTSYGYGSETALNGLIEILGENRPSAKICSSQ